MKGLQLQDPGEMLAALNQLEQFDAEAIYVGQRLKWNHTIAWPVLATTPLTISVNGHGCAVLFRYGVLVMFNIHGKQREQLLHQLQDMISEPMPTMENETVSIRVDKTKKEGADFESLIIHEVDISRIQVIADALAKSTVMAYYEQNVASQFEHIETLAERLHLGWRAGFQSRELLKHIGEALVMESKMIGRAEVVEKPEIAWDEPKLDRFYVRLEDEYELHERYEALERKFGLITRTAETQLSMLHARRSLRVEWYIVILIVIDILISLYKSV